MLINFVLRPLLAVGFGCIVVALALAAGFKSAQDSWLLYPQLFTRQELAVKKREIEAYRRVNHTVPQSLKQLKTLAGKSSSDVTNSATNEQVREEDALTDEPNGVFNDEWGHPFVYEVQGTRYRVISYGQDGTPGGVGIDTDMTTDSLHPPNSTPTFAQYLRHKKTEGLIPTVVLCGVTSSYLCSMLTRPEVVLQQKFWMAMARLTALFAATAIVTALITLLHFPAGH